MRAQCKSNHHQHHHRYVSSPVLQLGNVTFKENQDDAKGQYVYSALIFLLVATVLHLGNISFKENQDKVG